MKHLLWAVYMMGSAHGKEIDRLEFLEVQGL
jgi:hypothetical protein